MVRVSHHIYSFLFFIAISILTIIIVQTINLFVQKEIGMLKFVISLIIELTFGVAIVKVYDEVGCKWENIKILPISKKRKEEYLKVQNNYYYNTIPELKKFCPNCGSPIGKNRRTAYSDNEIPPKFCRNCGILLNETGITGDNQK
ncbi:MAG: hypothetical protein R3321_07805 [Nitrososphaeraceae archaeon]|nr:hypothetical protein [Nitrososphaeraceae archaeon]